MAVDVIAPKIIACSWKHQALLAELGASTFYETYADQNSEEDMRSYIAKTYSLTAIENNLAESAVSYFVAYVNEKDLGYVKLQEVEAIDGLNGKTIELEKIYVRKEAQGSQVAKMLMDTAIAYGKSKGNKFLYLGVWQENYRALAFYKKIGFEQFGTRQFQLGERICDDFLLKLEL